jgi:anti-sigma B factor antagonist
MATDRIFERAGGDALPSDASRVPSRPSGRREAAAASLVEEPARRPVSALSVACEEHGDLVVVALDGELDAYTTPGFREEVKRYDPAEVQLVIDLAGVSLLDSAGLGALVSLRNEAHRGGARLGLVCARRDLLRLFWITGLRPAFAFGETLGGLRAALAEGQSDGVGARHAVTG